MTDINLNNDRQESSSRKLSIIDKLLLDADRMLKTLTGNTTAQRESPAESHEETELSSKQRRDIAGLMRVNHTGEICAQALYQGQALTAKLPTIRNVMEQAAREEQDHLTWCEQRLQQLGSHTSLLNPAWYIGSFVLGAAAGAIGDRWSLGFVAATEERVCDHLKAHLVQLPEDDQKSRAVLKQMLVDEKAHGDKALEAGGVDFPLPLKSFMTATSKLMTKTSYHI
jgi:ubiquinone biosynthesis monooxygenase Coq7